MRREWLVPLMRIIAVAALSVGIAAFLWLGVRSQSSTPVSAATFLITVGNNWFCDASNQNGVCVLQVDVNDEVTWLFDSTVSHTTTECVGSCGSVIGNPASRLWDSGPITIGSFARTFDTPGTFEYQCNIHPTQMRGTIVVGGGGPTPFPTLPMPPSPLPTETETPFPTLPMPPSPAPSVTATPVATLPVPPSPAPSITATSVAPSATATSVPTDTPEPAPTSTPTGLLGDVNGDGMVDAIDAALVLQFVAAFLDSISNGDVNEDGTTNSIDAALILQFTAALINSLPP